MQDKYAGDIGDFGKFALLRALAPDRRIGVCWYRTDGIKEINSDGKHVRYLLDREKFQRLDPDVFESLFRIVDRAQRGVDCRSIEQLESANLLKSAIYHSKFVPRSKIERLLWRAKMIAEVEECDFIFVDPDNGLEGKRLTPKHVSLEEISALRRCSKRSVLLYCHQDRTKGGASAFAGKIRCRLRQIGVADAIVIRMGLGTSRCYVLIDYDAILKQRLENFLRDWSGHAALLLDGSS